MLKHRPIDRSHTRIPPDMRSRIGRTSDDRVVYVTGLLPEAPRRIIRVYGRHRGLVCALSGTHSPRGCVWWLWNDQTGSTTRFLTCRAG